MSKDTFLKEIFLSKIILTILICPSIGNTAQVGWDFKDECVGRSQLSIPFDSDVATYSLARMKKEIQSPGGQQMFQFNDGEEASWMTLQYARQLYISHPLSKKEMSDLKSAFSQQIRTMQKKFAESLSKTDREISISPISLTQDNVKAWSIAGGITALINVGNVALLANFAEKDDLSSNTQELSKFVSKFQARKIFDLPQQSGVCVPFGFISDNGSEPGKMFVTYRSKAHPDITISLEDVVVDATIDKGNSENPNIKKDLNSFWNQYRNIENGESIKSAWFIPATRSISLAGQNGEASFVQINRKDKRVDFGYLAITKKNDGEKGKSLRLLVIQDSEYTRHGEIRPLGKDEILHLAETIAKSVKTRSLVP